MENNRLFRLLSGFSKKELSAFRDFVHSPFFNKNKDCILLINILLKFTPGFDVSQFTEKKVLKLAGWTNQPEKLKPVLNKLWILAEDFLAHQAVREDSYQAEFYMLDALFELKRYDLYKKGTRKFRKKLEQEKRADLQSFWRYKLEGLHSSYLLMGKDDGTGDANRLLADLQLDFFYAISKLKQYCIILNRRRTATFATDDLQLSALESLFEDSRFNDHPVVRAWYHAFLLIRDNSKEDYQNLKAVLSEQSAVFPEDEIKILYTFLENSTPYIFDRSQLYSEYFELFKQQLDAGTYVVNGVINPSSFRNIVTVALVLDKTDWVRGFIREYKKFLPKTHPDSADTIAYSLAQLEFELFSFDRCLDHLNEVDGHNIYLKLNERRMRLKLYYELRYSQLFEDLVNSFRKFLSEKKSVIPQKHLAGHRDFVNCTLAMYKLIKGDQEKANNLEESIHAKKFLPEKGWLLEKLEKLK